MNSGLVSISIPCYNRELLVRHAIDSCLRQTYDAIEVIVVDDGSTDDSASVAESYGDPVRCIRSANHGVSHARNLGLEAAGGRFIQFLDSDDVLVGDSIEQKLRLFEAFPETEVVYSRVFSPTETDFGAGVAVPDSPRDLLETGSLVPGLEFEHVGIPAHACLYRREVFANRTAFDESLAVSEDLEINHRLYLEGVKFMLLDRIGLIYRDDRSISRLSDLGRPWRHEAFHAIEKITRLTMDKGMMSGAMERRFLTYLYDEGRACASQRQLAMARAYFDLAREVAPDETPGSGAFRALSRVIGPAWTAFLIAQGKRLLGAA